MADIYKRLRKHLDSLPVGYSKTISGVEYTILKKFFTPRHAEVALAMDHTFQSASELFVRLNERVATMDELSGLLEQMASAGCIMRKEGQNENRYALVPFVIGMFEFQNSTLTSELYNEAADYLQKGYAKDYLTTAVPQLRVIPVEKSITPEIKINTYDEIRKVVENSSTGISVADCICKKGRLLEGEPCTKSSSLEICIALNDYNEFYRREGWSRPISTEEALEILVQAEKDGLIIQTANEQNPQFICACCSCCCGILQMMNFFPRPVDFAATNFYAQVDPEHCTGCRLCMDRCNLDAIDVVKKKAVVSSARCVGCGLCVSSCKTGALQLVNANVVTVPPVDTDDLYDTIKRFKKNRISRLMKLLKALLNIKT